MNTGISVCIATIPPREAMLSRALASVRAQTLQPDAIIVEPDPDHTGAAATKNRALARAETEWVAFLDDDDEFLPCHLEKLLLCAQVNDADVVYAWPYVIGGVDPGSQYFGIPFDADALRRESFIHTTTLIRTEIFKKSGGFQCPPGSPYDDWGAYLALLDIGAHFVHFPERTFRWYHWNVHGTADNPGNTSGDPSRWR